MKNDNLPLLNLKAYVCPDIVKKRSKHPKLSGISVKVTEMLRFYLNALESTITVSEL